ncbi:LCP family protein [Lactobacillaceae bacterium L1_55_11]|nr:LCP family protein [Lactobacillaceae bacterium L1_55_11]
MDQRHQNQPDRQQPSTVKSNRWGGRLLNIFLIIILLLSIAGGLLFLQFKHSVDNMQGDAGISKARDVNQLIADKKPFSILVMGTDVGELNRDRDGLTDSMMVVTVNPSQNKITTMSIPRDIMVSIIGYEDTFPQKMNAAFPIGGVGAAMQTVQAYLNVPIDFYALVNMKGLETLVNQVGGVSVKSPLSFQYSQDTAHSYGPNLYRFHKGSTSYEHSDDNGKTWSASKTVMNGDAALAFTRMRYDDPDGDYGRQLRQRLVLKALIDKAVSPRALFNPGFMQSVSKSAETDISFKNMEKMLLHYRSAAHDQVSDHMQGTMDSYGGISYQMVPQKEKQRVTNVLRAALDLPKKSTGTQFGGEVPAAYQRVASDNLQVIGESLDTN